MPPANRPPRRLLQALTSALLLLTAASAFGARGPAQDDNWRRHNDRGNRYEGLIPVRTGKPDLDVLSFAGYSEPFEGDVVLKVKFFYPGQGRLSLIAREIDDQNQYWMEAKPWKLSPGDWNEFRPWPTRDVIRSEGIESGNLGVLIRLDGERFLPAFTYHTVAPDGGGRYVVHMVASQTLSRLTLTLAAAEGGSAKGQTKTWLMGRQSLDTPFPVRLDARGFTEGFLRLSVEMKPADGRQKSPPLALVFYHKPSAGH